MEQTKEYNAEDARAFMLDLFVKQGDFPQIMDEKTIEKLLGDVMALDEAFMQTNGVTDGEVYDDDAAFDYMHEKLVEKYPEHKMYAMRFVEDYMDYNEQYLDSIGAIDWE